MVYICGTIIPIKEVNHENDDPIMSSDEKPNTAHDSFITI
jgi:hypothetical protein